MICIYCLGIKNPELRLQVKNTEERMFFDVGEKAFIDQQNSMLGRSESESLLTHIICPTLVIHSVRDKIFTLKEHEELVNQIQNAKLALVDDSGHMTPVEMPQTITSLLRFWLHYF